MYRKRERSEKRKINSFLHRHPLGLCGKDDADVRRAVVCEVCGQTIHDLSYSCNVCGFHLDLSCAFLQQDECDENCSKILAFSCRSCNFKLCGVCHMMPLIRPSDGSILLGVFGCSGISRRNLSNHLSAKCVKNHASVLPIYARDSEFFIDKDRDDFCCHVCEGCRDPNSWVYCYPDCPFIVEIVCVFSEVSVALQGKRGHVKLISLTKRKKYEGSGQTRKFELIV